MRLHATALALLALTEADVRAPRRALDFEMTSNLDPDGYLYSVVAADFDGDGKLDLVTVGYFPVPGTYGFGLAGHLVLGRGGGAFAPPRVIHVVGEALVTADFDGDGKPD